MAQTVRSIPSNFPQPLGNHILKADSQRQISMLRQEIVTDLLGVLGETREPTVRGRLIKLIEGNLRSGLMAARRAEDLWPPLDEVKAIVEARAEARPAVAKKHIKLFEQYDRVQRRTLALLSDSFDHIRVILDRITPPEAAAPMLPAPTVPNARRGERP